MAYDFEKWVANDRKAVKRHRATPFLLAFMMLVMAVTAVMEMLDGGTETRRIGNFFPMAVTMMIAMLGSPFARDAWLDPRVEKMFDEFERDALARATTRSYSTLMAILVAVFTWQWVATVNGWPMPRTPLDWWSMGMAVVGIGAVLPIFFAEIMVPMPPAEDMLDD